MSKNTTTAEIIEVDHTHAPVIILRFMPRQEIYFEAGQFLSVKIPSIDAESIWRPYSFAKPYELSHHAQLYEICVKVIPKGRGSQYLASLKPGDHFELRAPYGEFVFHEKRGRPVVFIGTSTGIAPLRAMMLSEKFQKAQIPFSLAFFGFRNETEIPYPARFVQNSENLIYAVSRLAPNSNPTSPLLPGRVTDALKKLNHTFPWEECDFYLCGNPEMISEVRALLFSKNVQSKNIFFEHFWSAAAIQEKNAA